MFWSPTTHKRDSRIYKHDKSNNLDIGLMKSQRFRESVSSLNVNQVWSASLFDEVLPMRWGHFSPTWDGFHPLCKLPFCREAVGRLVQIRFSPSSYFSRLRKRTELRARISCLLGRRSSEVGCPIRIGPSRSSRCCQLAFRSLRLRLSGGIPYPDRDDERRLEIQGCWLFPIRLARNR
jgi:hypothetical protein